MIMRILATSTFTLTLISSFNIKTPMLEPEPTRIINTSDVYLSTPRWVYLD